MATKNTKKTSVAPAKVEEVKVEAVKAEVKEDVKATPVKKTDTKAATEKKATTEKKAPAKKATAKAPAKKSAEKKTELFVQFSGLEFSYEELVEKVKADYIAQTGKKTISSTKLYLKPEDMTVYYVVNEKFLGSVFLG